MKKKLLSTALALCMILTILPVPVLAAYPSTTIAGLTITQTAGESGGYSVPTDFWVNHSGLITITKPGSYTISGTYDSNAGSTIGPDGIITSPEQQWYENQTTWRGIIDVTQATGTINLTLDNVNIKTTYPENMPIILSRTNNGSADVSINLVGTNTLDASFSDTSIPGSTDCALGSGAIVKQGGDGSLIFTGSGSLNAKAEGVAIGSPYMIYNNSDGTTYQPYDCSDITFAQTGTITATTASANSACVGAAAGYASGYMLSATASNITVQSGTLNLVNTATGGTLQNGALLGCTGIYPYSAYCHNISVTGGKITTAVSEPVGSSFYSLGGGSVSYGYKGVTVTGGTIASGMGFKAYDARNGENGRAYGAFISTGDAVNSLSVKIDGADYPYTDAGVEPQNGKVWLYLPVGDAAVTLNGTNYYGVVDSSGNTELKQAFNKVTGITGLPLEMNANSTIMLAGVIAPSDATFTSINRYEILDAGTAGATLSGSKLTALAGGTVKLRAIVGNGLGTSDYTQDFSVTVNYTSLTGISGIPNTIQNGTAVTLTPSFTPSDASYQGIVWSVKSGSATLSGSKLTPTAPGTIVLTARVANGTAYGTDYTQDFTITVPSVPVTDITAGIPSTLTINQSLPLSGTVTPSNASYQTIEWSLVNTGTTGAAIYDGALKATAAGTLTLRARVANGSGDGIDFTKDYNIQVLAAGSVLDISIGYGISIASYDADNNKVTYSGYGGDGYKIVPKTETIIITGTNTGNQIIVDGTTAKILLQDVNLSSASSSDKNCIDLKNNASLTLSAAGSNTISAVEPNDAAPIHVPNGTALTIEDGRGSLTVTGEFGAAIGGNYRIDGNGEAGGTVTINGGTVTATSYEGAGIGGGGSSLYNAGAVGTVTINGGTVNAASSQGAGIGGGCSAGNGGAGGTVTINGGVVTASGGYYSAGIGGGSSNSTTSTGGAGSAVTITGGTVTATADYTGTMAIGGGINQSNAVAGNGTLTITGGSVITNRSITGGTSDYMYYNGTAVVPGSNLCIAATNGSGTAVYKTTVNLIDTVGANVALTSTNSIDSCSYGFHDVTTDDSGKLYLYLPENANRTATFNGISGYTGSTKSDDTGVLALSGLSAALELGTPYLTDSGATALATPSLSGTLYYLAVKDGAADAYTDADVLKNATGVKSAPVTANTAVTLTNMAEKQGTYTIYAALISSSGSYKSSIVTKTINIPATPPTLTVNDGSNDFTSDWYTTSQTLHISASDKVNGLKSVTIAVDGGNTQALFEASGSDTYSKDVTHSAQEGTHTYEIIATDNELNTTTRTFTINQDTDKPSIGVLTYSEHQSFLEWIFHKSSIEVTVPVTDDTSSADHISYVLIPDGGTAQAAQTAAVTDGSATFTVSKTFKGTIQITAYDKAGNASDTIKTSKMAVEGTAPTLTVNDFTSNWYTTAQTLNISAEDADSGLKSITYTVDGKNAKTLFTESVSDSSLTASKDGLTITAQEGEHTYMVTATDNALNTTTKTITVKQDTAKPAIGDIKYSEHQSFFDWIFHKSSIEVTVPVTDDTSGADHISYVLIPDGGTEQAAQTAAVTDGSSAFTVSKTFKGTIQITAYDKAGNASDTTTTSKMAVEGTAPTLTVNDFTSDWYTAAQTLNISAEDAGSGLKSITYTVDGKNVNTLFTESVSDSSLTASKDGLTITAQEGEHTYMITATDNALNTTTKTITVKQDTKAPTIDVSGNPAVPTQSAALCITAATGASGVKSVTVIGPQGDKDITVTYQNGYAVTQNGTYTFTLTNNAGISISMSVIVTRIDTAKPVVAIDSNDYVDGAWTKNYVKLDISNTTTNLGTTTLGYSTDDGKTWVTFNGSLTDSTEGVTAYSFRAVSESGIQSEVKTITVKIDKTAPTNLAIGFKQNPFKSVAHFVTFGIFFGNTVDGSFTAEDLSGVDYYEYQSVAEGGSFDSTGTWQTGLPSIAPDFKGTIYARAVDKVGNVSGIVTKSLVVDETVPVIMANSGNQMFSTLDANASIPVEVKDNGAGIGAVTYQIDGGEVQTVDLTSIEYSDMTKEYSFNIDSLPDGIYDVTINAVDNAGNAAATATVHVTKSAVQTGFGFAPATLSKTYGDAPFTVSATGGQGNGTVTYTVTKGADVLSVDASTGKVTMQKAGTAVITATKAAGSGYAAATARLTVNVSKAEATVQAIPTASDITVIGKLSASQLKGGKASVPGTFNWTNPDTVVSSSGSYSVTFTPKDAEDYNTVTCNVPVTVSPILTDNGSDALQLDCTDATMPSGVTSVSLTSDVQSSNSSTNSVVEKLIGQDESLGGLSGLTVYDLKLLDQNGNPVEHFTGKIKVKIPIPEGMSGNLKVFWYNPADGTLTDMNAKQENGYLVFETTHFSFYAIAQLKKSPVSNPKTGTGSWPIIPLTLLCGSAAFGAMIVKQRKFSRKKKKA